ncbi:hypothetical protein [Labilibacter marinus]|uniref:hypothetical protein n=1 Tax=Labilibacter marinus TaxID=1477105 RepID=UPI00094FA1C5|nr:hypothetical protein [Labilibacter marinus]
MIEKISWVKNNLEVSFCESCTFSEIKKVNEKVYGDARFDKMEYQIFDFSRVSELLLTPKELKIVGVLDRSASRWNRNVCIALVVTMEYVRNLALEYGKLMEGSNWSVYLFSTYDKAKHFCKNTSGD